VNKETILHRTIKILEKYPLCDRCLGRMFAKLGYNLTNKDRGRALKITVIMELHKRIQEGNEEALELFKRIAPHIGEAAGDLYRKLLGEELDPKTCAICQNNLDKFISEAAQRAVSLLRAYDIKRFVVGVRAPRSVLELEDAIKAEFGLEYGESIKAEIRREVGKLIQSMGDFIADFENPEATVLIEYPSGALWLQVNSLLLKGRYWKKGRLISQAYWPTPTGPKYYSLEQALWALLRLTGGERVIVHASGREDVDARMLGTGRPLVIEVKSPRRRQIPLEQLEQAANS
jgi:tRNA pseudouridine synthase 10